VARIAVDALEAVCVLKEVELLGLGHRHRRVSVEVVVEA
jgi:hypothetical protein